MFEENMSLPKTPKTPQRIRLSLKEKIKIIEDSKKPGSDKAKINEEYGISRPTVINHKSTINFDTLCVFSCTAYLVTPLDLVTAF